MTAGKKMTAEVVDAPITQSGRDDLAQRHLYIFAVSTD